MQRPIANDDVGSAGRAIVARRKSRALRITILKSMNRAAVPQREIAIVDIYDRQDSVKISGRRNDVIQRGFLRNQQAGREQRKNDSGRVADEHRRWRGLWRSALDGVQQNSGGD